MSDVNGTPARTQADIEAEIGRVESAEVALLTGGGETEAEAEASRKGWVPKDKYRGDPAKWKDAETFLEAGKRFNSNLQRELQEVRQQLEEFKGTQKAFAQFHDEMMQRKNTEIAEAMAALRVQRSQAIREGDDQLTVEIEDRIDLLKEQQKELKKVPDTQVPADGVAPEVAKANQVLLDAWIEDGNEWFRDDQQLREYALTVGKILKTQDPTLAGRKFLNLVRNRMEEDFPRRFKKASTPANANAVESGSSSTGGAGGHTVRDLPAEDLALMKRFIKDGITTEAKFLANYFSDAPRKHS